MPIVAWNQLGWQLFESHDAACCPILAFAIVMLVKCFFTSFAGYILKSQVS